MLVRNICHHFKLHIKCFFFIAFGTYSHLVAVASDWPVGHSFLCKVRHLLNVSRACALTHNTHLLPRRGYSGHFGGGTEIWIRSDLYLSLETLPLRIRWFWGRSVTWMKQELDIVQSIWLKSYGQFWLSRYCWILRHLRQHSNSCSWQLFEYSNFALFYPIIYTPRLSDNWQKAKLASPLLYCSAWPRPIKHPKVETRTPENNRRAKEAAACLSPPRHLAKRRIFKELPFIMSSNFLNSVSL